MNALDSGELSIRFALANPDIVKEIQFSELTSSLVSLSI
jgi:hypothetical protein